MQKMTKISEKLMQKGLLSEHDHAGNVPAGYIVYDKKIKLRRGGILPPHSNITYA